MGDQCFQLANYKDLFLVLNLRHLFSHLDIIDRFSSSQGRRDQGPNQELAAEIVEQKDLTLLGKVLEVIDLNPSERIVNDAVMTLMAISEQDPNLLATSVPIWLDLLKSRSNRQVWGSMVILSHLAPLKYSELRQHLLLILESMDMGSVVGRDHGYSILCEFYRHDKDKEIWPLMTEQLLKSPPNQFGQYIEKTMEVLRKQDREELIRILEIRLDELDHPNHRKRALKNLKQLRQ